MFKLSGSQYTPSRGQHANNVSWEALQKRSRPNQTQEITVKIEPTKVIKPFNQRRLSLTVGHEPADQDGATKLISVLYSGIIPPYGKKRLGHVTTGHSLGLSFKKY